MADLLITLAEAVKDSLNGGSFGQAFVAVRQLLVEDELPDLETLDVTVMPASREVTPADRSSDFWELGVFVGIRKKWAAEADIDAMMDLVQEILDWLNRRPMTVGEYTAKPIRLVNAPAWAQEHLLNLRQFTAVITVTYRLTRPTG